jgi:dienelactone hydrolase
MREKDNPCAVTELRLGLFRLWRTVPKMSFHRRLSRVSISRSILASVPFLAAALLPLAMSRPARTQEKNPPAASPYYEEDVRSSDPIRTEQAKELDAYVNQEKNDRKRLNELFHPDYTSPRAFELSAAPLRRAFERSIGYPPPGKPDAEEAQFTKIGEDKIGTYYRTRIPVLPGVHAVGIYIVPKGVIGRLPLIVSMHGGGGSPEVALFHGGANYHDMVRGGVERGYAVWAPTHLFHAEGYPNDVRNRIDLRMRMVGTSLTAVEIAKITRGLDVILKRPEIDPKRVGMVGLSYGGYYTLVTAALEPRIKAAVSSCYFGVQEGRYEQDELSVPSDFQFSDRFTLFRDQQLVALICPRALEIQAGAKDNASHREMGRRIAPEAAQYYKRLGMGKDFRFVIFEGGHEWNGESGWEWIKAHL